jgi:hypothetical protein
MQQITMELCYQPTYEELKLQPSIEILTPIDGYQPTYEELKHVVLDLHIEGA